MRLSANLGFLWTGLALPDAIRAAARAGFDAVELHYPYATPADTVRLALEETGLALLSLNTDLGGARGLAAVPGQDVRARALIDQALDYAQVAGARMVHVMSGNAEGDAARATLIENLHYALDRVGERDLTLLIEPLCPKAAPGYYLNSTYQAADIISEIGSDRLRLMFDCYHVHEIDGDPFARATELCDMIGHVQIAAIDDRGPPDHGALNFEAFIAHLQSLGYQGDIGAEYIVAASDRIEDTLGWMSPIRAARQACPE